ncbi:MAG TPA: ATP-binding protein [Acidocella sp.]|jgi:PAS domain S-box-containing protein|nr:ATP-binding protein [Acidocella sp.]
MPGGVDQATEVKFRYLMDTAPVMIWVAGTDNLCTFFNEPWLTFTGRTMEQELGNGWWEGVHPDDVARCHDIYPSHIDHREPFRIEYRLRRADGEYRWLLDNGAPRFDTDGTFLGYIGSCIDITDRKRAETEARESEQRYREVQMELAHANRVATTGLLTASITHEVNQPIAAAVINANAALNWLSAQPPALEEARQALIRIVRDANRAGDVIGRIRALIKKTPPRKDEVAINDAILEVVALTDGEAMRNGVSVQTDLADSLPLIRGDRVQLQQVILNLIINAIEAMNGRNEGVREVLISTERTEADAVLVAVRDSGPGLAPEALERLFGAFYTTKPSGLGLGLSICRSIIEAHGGRLWATPNLPHGAIFRFTVPAYVPS